MHPVTEKSTAAARAKGIRGFGNGEKTEVN
jgi:hypothetical protein